LFSLGERIGSHTAAGEADLEGPPRAAFHIATMEDSSLFAL